MAYIDPISNELLVNAYLVDLFELKRVLFNL